MGIELIGDLAVIALIVGSATVLTFIGVKSILTGQFLKNIVYRYEKRGENKKFINRKVRKTMKRYDRYKSNKSNLRQRKYRNMMYLLSESHLVLSNYAKFFENIEDECFSYDKTTGLLKNNLNYNIFTGKCQTLEALKIAKKQKEKAKKSNATETNKFKIIFDPSDGKFNGKNVGQQVAFEKSSGSKIYMPDETKIKKKNNILVGWQTDLKNGAARFYDPKQCFPVGKTDTTFKAVWKINEQLNIKSSETLANDKSNDKELNNKTLNDATKTKNASVEINKKINNEEQEEGLSFTK